MRECEQASGALDECTVDGAEEGDGTTAGAEAVDEAPRGGGRTRDGGESPVARGAAEKGARDVLGYGYEGREGAAGGIAAHARGSRAGGEGRMRERLRGDVHDGVGGDGVDGTGWDDDGAGLSGEVVEPR